MCNGRSNRISRGGSIAVLRPTQHLPRADTGEMMLFFHNALSSSGTSVELLGWASSTQLAGENGNEDENGDGSENGSENGSESGSEDGNDRHWVVIQ